MQCNWNIFSQHLKKKRRCLTKQDFGKKLSDILDQVTLKSRYVLRKGLPLYSYSGDGMFRPSIPFDPRGFLDSWGMISWIKQGIGSGQITFISSSWIKDIWGTLVFQNPPVIPSQEVWKDPLKNPNRKGDVWGSKHRSSQDTWKTFWLWHSIMMMFLFQGCILRFHVNLPGCIWGKYHLPVCAPCFGRDWLFGSLAGAKPSWVNQRSTSASARSPSNDMIDTWHEIRCRG